MQIIKLKAHFQCFIPLPSFDSQRWLNFNQSCQQLDSGKLIKNNSRGGERKIIKNNTFSITKSIPFSPSSVDTCPPRTFYDRKNSQPWEGSVYYSQVCREVLISHVKAHQRTKARVFWRKFIVVIKLRYFGGCQVDWTSREESKFKLRWFSQERNVLQGCFQSLLSKPISSHDSGWQTWQFRRNFN